MTSSSRPELMRSVYRSEKQLHTNFQGNLVQFSRATVNRVKTRFSERDRSNESGNRFENSVHSVFRLDDLANVGKPLVDGNEDHLLHQAGSEFAKQEHQVGSLNNCFCELQQHACAQRQEEVGTRKRQVGLKKWKRHQDTVHWVETPNYQER